MNEKQEQTATADAPKQVGVRLYQAEIDAVKQDTGATSDATAVACFVRRNLRKQGNQ